MLSFPFLLATSRAVLTHSRAIRGRVFMAPFLASELNAPNLKQIIADSLTGTMSKDYPLSLILPPKMIGDLAGTGQWNDYLIQQLFLKQEGRTSGGDIQALDIMTNQSQHTIPEDWHDMSRVAINYLRTLRQMHLEHPTFARLFRLSQAGPNTIIPITRLANDRTNGVLLTHTISLFESCVTGEEYDAGAIAQMQLPTGDQHPEHTL